MPTPLIQSLSGPKIGTSVHKCISALAKVGLIAKVKNASYDGYRLTYGGMDYLSLNTHRKSNAVFSLGNQIGVGKESDIYVVASPEGRKLVLKIHRLGRISFRTVKANRDYLRNRNSGSWMYLSKLAAQKEYAFMQILRREGFPVPEPVAQSRHTLVMEFIDSFPLRQIEEVADPAALYSELMDLIVRLARVGLIHGDFNEFNILIREEIVGDQSDADNSPLGTEQEVGDPAAPEAKLRLQHNSTVEEQASGKVRLIPILIDFPQMLSTTHQNAKYYFDRDVDCIKRFFGRRFKYETDEEGPHFEESCKPVEGEKRLDVEVEATGFSRKMAKELERYIEAVGTNESEDHEKGRFVEGDEEENEYYQQDDVPEQDPNQDQDQDQDQDQQHEIILHEPEQDQSTQKENSKDKKQVVETKLVQEVSNLGLEDRSFGVKGDDGVIPVELPKHPVAAAKEKKIAKKKAGWAI